MVDMQSKLVDLGFRPPRFAHTPHDATALLQRIPWTLPDDYCEFLCMYGGGEFDRDVVVRCEFTPPVAEDGKCLFGEFFDLGQSEASLDVEWRRAQELIGEGVVPFASAAGGDLYCMRACGSDRAIVFWDHDSGRTYVTASSFTDFVQRLEPAPEGPKVDLDKIKLTLDPDLL